MANAYRTFIGKPEG